MFFTLVKKNQRASLPVQLACQRSIQKVNPEE